MDFDLPSVLFGTALMLPLVVYFFQKSRAVSSTERNLAAANDILAEYRHREEVAKYTALQKNRTMWDAKR